MSNSDGSGLSSDHLVHAAPVISNTLADLCTAIIRHGHMPEALSNCILVPIPKGQKTPTKSDNYRPVALTLTLSKVIEQDIILQYSEFFFTCDLQFRFKKGFSTSLCTAVLKNTVSRYIHWESTVLGCFLDASKGFPSCKPQHSISSSSGQKIAPGSHLYVAIMVQESTVAGTLGSGSFGQDSCLKWCPTGRNFISHSLYNLY